MVTTSEVLNNTDKEYSIDEDQTVTNRIALQDDQVKPLNVNDTKEMVRDNTGVDKK